jgi:hypothetical protein
MAGHKAIIDKDGSRYRSPTSAPESERQTAYDSQTEIEGPNDDSNSKDRNGNGDSLFKGNTKAKQGRRKADQNTTGTEGSMGEERDSPFRKVLSSRFGLDESENPGVASSPSTSDNPSLGMNSINNSDFKQSKTDVKGMLETIALQSAEAFEVLDENNQVPDALASELDQCSKVIDRLYEYATQNQRNNPQTGVAPAGQDNATLPVRREETEMSEDLVCIRAESAATGERFESEAMTEEEANEIMDEMIESDAYSMIEMHLSPKQKKIARLAPPEDEIDASDLATLRAKRKMQEAVVGVFNHLINEGAE